MGSRRKNALMVIIVLALLSSMLTVESQTLQVDSPQRVMISAYIAHPPITIVDNSNLSGMNASTGISWGNGSQDDPYIIQGWEIDATGFASAIYIANHSAHFEILGCYLHNANNNGISLKAMSNCSLENNTCSSNQYGIKLDSSRNIQLRKNNCSDNSNTGIYLSSSDNNTLIGNTISYNSNYGSRGEQSRDNQYLDNILRFNPYGISLSSSDFNFLSNNSCSNNTNSGIQCSDSHNGTITKNNCSGNAFYGINVGASNDTNMSDNLCSYNKQGISISGFSANDTVSGNNCSYNTLQGILLGASTSGNKIWNNTIGFNNGSNHTYSEMRAQASDSGSGNRWNSSNHYGNYWSDWQYQDLNTDGIVDTPLNISGSAGAKDFYPLTLPAFQYDITPPITLAVPAGTPGENGWFISPVTLTLSATDTESSVDRIEYKCNGSDWQTYGAQIDFPADGTNTVEYRSADRAGNMEAAKNISINIDRIAPVTISEVNGSKVTLIANDSLSGVSRTVYSIDSGSWRNYYGTIKITESGNHTMEFYSIDVAGNVGQVNTAWVDNGMSIFEIISAYGLDIVIIIIIIVIVIAVFNSRNKEEKIE